MAIFTGALRVHFQTEQVPRAVSMMIADTASFDLGPYTVQQRPRFDSPAWAQYLVYRGVTLIGKSFSRPDLGCCKWLEEHRGLRPIYATQAQSAKLREHTLRGIAKPRITFATGPA